MHFSYMQFFEEADDIAGTEDERAKDAKYQSEHPNLPPNTRIVHRKPKTITRSGVPEVWKPVYSVADVTVTKGMRPEVIPKDTGKVPLGYYNTALKQFKSLAEFTAYSEEQGGAEDRQYTGRGSKEWNQQKGDVDAELNIDKKSTDEIEKSTLADPMFAFSVDVEDEEVLDMEVQLAGKRIEGEIKNFVPKGTRGEANKYDMLSDDIKKEVTKVVNDAVKLFALYNAGKSGNPNAEQQAINLAFKMRNDGVKLTASGKIDIGALAHISQKEASYYGKVSRILEKTKLAPQLNKLLRLLEDEVQDVDKDKTLRFLYADEPRYLLTPSFMFGDGELDPQFKKKYIKHIPGEVLMVGNATYQYIPEFTGSDIMTALMRVHPEKDVLELRREAMKVKKYITSYNGKIQAVADFFKDSVAGIQEALQSGATKGLPPEKAIIKRVMDQIDQAFSQTGNEIEHEVFNLVKRNLVDMSNIAKDDKFDENFSTKWSTFQKQLIEKKDDSKFASQIKRAMPYIAESMGMFRQVMKGNKVFVSTSTTTQTIDFIAIGPPPQNLNVTNAEKLIESMSAITTTVELASAKAGDAGRGAISSTLGKLGYSKFKSRVVGGKTVYDDEIIKNDLETLSTSRKRIFDPESSFEEAKFGIRKMFDRYSFEINTYFGLPQDTAPNDAFRLVFDACKGGTKPRPGLVAMAPTKFLAQFANSPEMTEKYHWYFTSTFLLPAIYNNTVDIQINSNESYSKDGFTTTNGIDSIAYLVPCPIKSAPKETGIPKEPTVQTGYKNSARKERVTLWDTDVLTPETSYDKDETETEQ